MPGPIVITGKYSAQRLMSLLNLRQGKLERRNTDWPFQVNSIGDVISGIFTINFSRQPHTHLRGAQWQLAVTGCMLESRCFSLAACSASQINQPGYSCEVLGFKNIAHRESNPKAITYPRCQLGRRERMATQIE